MVRPFTWEPTAEAPGVPYYHNPYTQETGWELPTATASSAPQNADPPMPRRVLKTGGPRKMLHFPSLVGVAVMDTAAGEFVGLGGVRLKSRALPANLDKAGGCEGICRVRT